MADKIYQKTKDAQTCFGSFSEAVVEGYGTKASERIVSDILESETGREAEEKIDKTLARLLPYLGKD